MTAGGGAADMLMADRQVPELYAEGAHHLWQDFTAVSKYAAPLLLEGLVRFTGQLGVDPGSVDHYVVSIPTRKLYEEHIPAFLDRLHITRKQIKFRCSDIGYVGGAATLVHLDQMARSGELQQGQLVVVHAVESSKWMTAGFALRW
jgi:3-oxoacyl-[acyl-carrier-protein] synthase III